jgi:hypothetical protein
VPHVLEARRTGPFVVQVGDQFAKNPSLIGISDSTMPVLPARWPLCKGGSITGDGEELQRDGRFLV